jgi:hypothetical protein
MRIDRGMRGFGVSGDGCQGCEFGGVNWGKKGWCGVRSWEEGMVMPTCNAAVDEYHTYATCPSEY